MKTIIRVAKTELRNLFYSPIAWFLLIVFLIQCAVAYTGSLGGYARQQELGGRALNYMANITEYMFLSPSGLFGKVMQNLYLFIPLLTMSLISREMSSGTIKLLYSSPVKVREIVLGKYLAMMVYSLLLLAIVAIFVISGIFHVQHPQTGMLLTSLLGFYLLLLAYCAIGLFMSSLTTYQVVAAVCTFVMIGILSYIGTLWQKIAFVRELTYYLSINGRTQKMLTGLVTTKDVLYFLVIVYIFIGLTIYKLKAGMESKPMSVKIMRYAFVIVSALAIGYISSVPALIGYYDATIGKKRTITPQVQKVLADLGDAPLEVTAYNNLLGRFWFLGSNDSYNLNQQLWEPYTRFKQNIIIHEPVKYYDSAFDNPYLLQSYPGDNMDQVAQKYAKSNETDLKSILKPAQIRQLIDLRPEQNRYVMQLKWKGRTTWLRVFDDMAMWPGETEVAAALKRLQQASLPKIAFLSGELERDISRIGDRDYMMITNMPAFRNSLVNQGFDVDTISLDEQDVPANISTLVLADPKIALTSAAMERLKKYIRDGRNIMICGEPGKQSILNPLLQELGVQIMDGMVIQESKNQAPNLVIPYVTGDAGKFTPTLQRALRDSIIVSMPGAAGLKWDNGGAYTITPLLLTDPKTTWIRMKPLDLEMATSASAGENTVNAEPAVVRKTEASSKPAQDEMTPAQKKHADSAQAAVKAILSGPGTKEEKMKKIQGMIAKARAAREAASAAKPVVAAKGASAKETVGTVTFNAADGDVRGPVATVVSLSRKVNGKEQRIIVAGDADFLSNAELSRFNPRNANFTFNTALFSWLSNGEFPIDTSRPEPEDKRVNVTMAQVDFMKIIYVWVLPAVLLIFATVLLVRRKRK